MIIIRKLHTIEFRNENYTFSASKIQIFKFNLGDGAVKSKRWNGSKIRMDNKKFIPEIKMLTFSLLRANAEYIGQFDSRCLISCIHFRLARRSVYFSSSLTLFGFGQCSRSVSGANQHHIDSRLEWYSQSTRNYFTANFNCALCVRC